MLEMGFRKPIEQIISFLPRERQTMLFSATVTKDLLNVVSIAVKKDYKFINTISKDEASTHESVP